MTVDENFKHRSSLVTDENDGPPAVQDYSKESIEILVGNLNEIKLVSLNYASDVYDRNLRRFTNEQDREHFDLSRLHITNSSWSLDDATEIENTLSTYEISGRKDRFNFAMKSESVAEDTHYQGCVFIMTWLGETFKTSDNVRFDRIFKLLIDGIKEEAIREEEKTSKRCNVEVLLELLTKVAENNVTYNERRRLQKLREACVTVYTAHSFLYRKTNEALRDNDESKRNTLGPFCYLIYDYIGRQTTENMSKIHRLRQTLHIKKKKPMQVYRRDTASIETLKEYDKAAGNPKKLFKWSCFVSTSEDVFEALKFGTNVLYKIDLGRYKWNDQFAKIAHLSYYPHEKETLLIPGVRFAVDRFEERWKDNLALVSIYIRPSTMARM